MRWPRFMSFAPHRMLYTRWTVTVLAFVMLVATMLGMWFSARWFDGWSICVGVDRGNLLIDCGVPQQLSGADLVFATSEWSPVFRWQYDPGTLRARCWLGLVALPCAAMAAWLWYRRWRPFVRGKRPDRLRQWSRTRWSVTVLWLVLVACVAATFAWRAQYEWAWTIVRMERGVLFFAGYEPGAAFAPFRSNGWTLSPVEPASMYAHAWWDPSSGTVFDFSSPRGVHKNWLFARVSLWFVVILGVVPVAMLWFVRLRSYVVARGPACPDCLYDLSGLAANVPCPECGCVRVIV